MRKRRAPNPLGQPPNWFSQGPESKVFAPGLYDPVTRTWRLKEDRIPQFRQFKSMPRMRRIQKPGARRDMWGQAVPTGHSGPTGDIYGKPRTVNISRKKAVTKRLGSKA